MFLLGGATRSSDQISKITDFVTVNIASSTPVPTPSPSPPPSLKSKKGLALGLGIGVPVLCFLIITTGWLIFRYHPNYRASNGNNSSFIAENGTQPIEKNPESLLPHELPDNKVPLSELPEGRENPSLPPLRTELPTNSPPLAEMRGN